MLILHLHLVLLTILVKNKYLIATSKHINLLMTCHIFYEI